MSLDMRMRMPKAIWLHKVKGMLMELPNDLKFAIEQQTVGIPQNKLRSAAEGISLRYRNETGEGKRLVSTAIDTLAYAVVRMPATYGAVYSALNDFLDINHPEIKTVLDVGAGMGTVAWAVGSTISTAERIVCLEREPAMIDFGKTLMKASPSLMSKTEWLSGDMRDIGSSMKYDLVVASYALGELNDRDREKMIVSLWDITDKILLIVEPGTPLAFSHLRSARTQLIDKGAVIIAPCPHSKSCPLPDDDWCHFTCRIARSRLHKQLKGGEVPYEDEKFSYLAASKEPVQTSINRVLRHPFIEEGRITLKLCTEKGIETRIITKKQKDRFKAARKAKCGDAFS